MESARSVTMPELNRKRLYKATFYVKDSSYGKATYETAAILADDLEEALAIAKDLAPTLRNPSYVHRELVVRDVSVFEEAVWMREK